MTRDVAGRAQLGAALRRIKARTCCFCECEGGRCKTETGEPCELVTENVMRKRCTGVACVYAEARYQRTKTRGRKTRPGKKAA